MRAKHNKKRNTAFLYETLVKQLTKSIVDKDARQKRAILSTLREFFGRASLLRKELECYHTLLEAAALDTHTAEKLLHETKVDRARLDSKMIFDAQSSLIKQMTTLSPEVWNNFIPNYKSLASINAIFNHKTPAKKRVLYENTIVAGLTTEAGNDTVLQPIDNIVYRSFVKKFNNEYAGLLEEQKRLLAQYISSFVDNGIEFKLHLNEELGRLKNKIGASLELQEIRSDEEMLSKTHEVMDILEGFKTMPPTEELVRRVLKIQALAREVNS